MKNPYFIRCGYYFLYLKRQILHIYAQIWAYTRYKTAIFFVYLTSVLNENGLGTKIPARHKASSTSYTIKT